MTIKNRLFLFILYFLSSSSTFFFSFDDYSNYHVIIIIIVIWMKNEEVLNIKKDTGILFLSGFSCSFFLEKIIKGLAKKRMMEWLMSIILDDWLTDWTNEGMNKWMIMLMRKFVFSWPTLPFLSSILVIMSVSFPISSYRLLPSPE